MKKSISLDFITRPDEPKENNDLPFLESIQRYADSWISGTGALPNYKINSIIVYLQAENKHVKKVVLDVLKEKRHIQFKISCSIFTLIFGSRRNLIIDTIQSIMDDFVKGWTFNVIFVRG